MARVAGCVVTSSIRPAPMTQTLRPSRRLSRYSAPVRITIPPRRRWTVSDYAAIRGCVPNRPALQYWLTFLYSRHASVTRRKAYGFDLQSGTCGYYLRRFSEDAGLLHSGAGPHRHRRGPGAGELLPQRRPAERAPRAEPGSGPPRPAPDAVCGPGVLHRAFYGGTAGVEPAVQGRKHHNSPYRYP